ncbi:hypothetical protein H8356DRAFT_1407290 [Neocallimastix lanati (nom. inval.)]|uniref:Uncharacterized protein n=1 Tax=Neocallimastix californiae TaxID=1754190 RepID=A0A1Y2BU40_9FUNG|nr:hypothetical protein H8356DRAFT_1407290 [Neocallimastix sp. JGI-2020a]ORY38266.1 hypothetical protein LY90DRAFT_623884 [Neocallimastix californiae]|eukprot:ORY38266.1 hypothetical protein LY90DRAFT_623884 [Neocallimastix californiae]
MKHELHSVIECSFQNNYYFNNSLYKHIKSIINCRLEFLRKHPNLSVNIFENYGEIIKIIYDKKKDSDKKGKNPNFLIFRSFILEDIYKFYEREKKKAQVFLVSTNSFSWSNKNINDLIERLCSKKYNHEVSFTIQHIRELDESPYEVLLKANHHKGDYNIYFFLIVSNSYKNETNLCCITQPFTLMTFKNLSKRPNGKSYLCELENKSLNTLAYYYDVIFNEGRTTFKNNFPYRMNYHFFRKEELIINNNTMGSIEIVLSSKIFKDILISYRKAFKNIINNIRNNDISNFIQNDNFSEIIQSNKQQMEPFHSFQSKTFSNLQIESSQNLKTEISSNYINIQPHNTQFQINDSLNITSNSSSSIHSYHYNNYVNNESSSTSTPHSNQCNELFNETSDCTSSTQSRQYNDFSNSASSNISIPQSNQYNSLYNETPDCTFIDKFLLYNDLDFHINKKRRHN